VNHGGRRRGQQHEEDTVAAARPILYATDFSPASAAAFRAAVDAALGRRAELIVVHVVAIPVPEDWPTAPYDALLTSIERHVEQRLDRLVRRGRGHGVRARALVLRGVPFDAIIGAARRHRAQLVVIGTHGRTGFQRWMLGSVASRVVALAPCPVLTVPAPRHTAARVA
jgi:nucleotide-binding universal stress UspA family protein